MDWHNLTATTAHSTHEITYNQSETNPQFIWVSGMSDDQIAKVNISDPTDQYRFQFATGSRPHTLRFDDQGKLWVGLEFQGKIVRLKDLSYTTERYVTLSSDDFEVILDVKIRASHPSIPFALNTHPHGFCFDQYGNIWFTGKLTNTVGRVNITSHEVEHFEIPTLGAVNIYLSLGPDGNIWGTCLENNNIFRITTGANPFVTEIPITRSAGNSRPIAIIPGPPGSPFMYWSNELGHTICRINVFDVESVVSQNGNRSDNPIFNTGNYFLPDLVQYLTVPMTQRNMLLAGLAFDDEGNLWTQSYVDQSNPLPMGRDYIVKVDRIVEKVVPESDGQLLMTAVPIEYNTIPTEKTVLHRIISGPDGRIWFTELYADRVGVVTDEAKLQRRKVKSDDPRMSERDTRGEL
jgi:virginiamycin B lyase